MNRMPFIAALILAASHSRQSESAEAIAQAREAVRLRPNEAIGHIYLSNVLIDPPFNAPDEEKRRMVSEARTEMLTAIRLGRGEEKAYAAKIASGSGWRPDPVSP